MKNSIFIRVGANRKDFHRKEVKIRMHDKMSLVLYLFIVFLLYFYIFDHFLSFLINITA